ncbi:delta-60 repeat domain-containing protein [Sorangium sp. So ce426]|uniref:delta-60 repeat domain-containing protein n=1 Tax=Sorangium sp. So ce426 TaxID=3133312 RepID=UPI003F5B74F7
MNSTSHRRTAALARVAARAALLGGAAALLGCEALLGIEDVSLDSGAGGGASSSSSPSGSPSGSGGGTADGGGGQGGQAEGDFTFAILADLVDVPYNGVNHVTVAITRIGGFDEPVVVDVQAAPVGLVADPITIPSGSSRGTLEVGASGALTLGTAFDLDLIATSGRMARTDSARAVVTGKPGTLDESFGAAGITSWNLASDGGGLHDIRQAASGQILTAGNSINGLGAAKLEGFRVLRDGSLDAAFAGGRVTSSFCSCTEYQEIRGITRLLNGAVFLAGYARGEATDDIAFLRYRDNGTQDTIDSANTGKGLIDLGGDEHVTAMDLSASEQLLVTGERDGQLFVAAINPTYGYLDTKFASVGWIAPLGVGPSAGTALAARPDGLLVAGWAEQGGDRDIVLAQLAANGAVSGLGDLTIVRPGEQEPVAVVVQPNGSILVGARSTEAGSSDFLVVRLDADGLLDTTFGEDGFALAGLAGGEAVDMALMPDGRIVVAGNVGQGANSQPTLVRFLPDGALDPTFGDKGVQALYLGEEDVVQSMTLSTDGKLLVAGTRQTFPTHGLVARLWN